MLCMFLVLTFPAPTMNVSIMSLAIVLLLWLVWRAIVLRLRPKDPDRTGNGIAAGELKVYDNRFLSIRLEELEASLEKLGATPLPAIDESVGSIQSRLSNTNETGFSAGPARSKSETKTDPSKEAPKQPESDSKISPSARDRLAELINLRYEILGLRMILERSLTDRLLEDKAANEKDARLQAVLGLQVSLDPPFSSAGCAAIVEAALQIEGQCAAGSISLVALLPQEQSSNTIFASNQSFSASAAGQLNKKRAEGWWRRKAESVISLREPDTVAFQRPREVGKSLTVGWEFRPPLSRASVTPGVRQVFAIVALPSIDKYPSDSAGPSFKIKADVRTYWRRYNARTGTTLPRWKRVRSWLLDDDARNEPSQLIDLNFSDEVQKRLQPELVAIKTTQLSSEKALVMIDGRNFFPGTTVAVGDMIHRDLATGLLIKSDHHMQVATTPKALAYGNGVVNGRYGPTVQLYITPPVASIWVAWCELELSALGNFHELHIYMADAQKANALTVKQLAKLPDPIVMVDDQVIPPPFYIEDSYLESLNADGYPFVIDTATSAKINCTLLSVWVPAEWNPLSARFKLSFPFCGTEYQHAFYRSESDPAFALTRWARGSMQSLLITATGGEFAIAENWCVELDQEYRFANPSSSPPAAAKNPLTKLSKTELLLELPAETMEKHRNLVVKYSDPIDGQSLYTLDLPPSPAVPKARIDTSGVEISSSSANFTKLSGVRLNLVAEVWLHRGSLKSKLDFSVADDHLQMIVYVPTGQSLGFAQLMVWDVSQTSIGEVPVIIKA
jgi:hypothetical protein